MNLRNISGEYNIGLDLGTGSVGWAVTDENGELLHFKKQPTWGSRLFDTANTAADARVHRGQRRRYIRRRWRLNLLQQLFEEEMVKADPDFFNRLAHSRTVEGDPIFNGSDFTKADYYKRFPTIYHLRKWLMETDEKADIRLVYLALHNIVKHRGNFLREGKPLNSEGAKPDDALKALREALKDWCGENDHMLAEDKTAQILEIFADSDMRPSDKKKALAPLIGVSLGDEPANSKKFNEAIAGAIVGLKAEFKNVFGETSCETSNFSLSNEEHVEAFRDACPDDGVELFEALCGVYSSYLLQGLLSYAPGKSISKNMVAKYDRYAEDLALLKGLVKTYAPEKYDAFFRGPLYEGTNIYDAAKAQGYTKYNLGTSKLDYDGFANEVKKLLGKTAAVDDPRYDKMMDEFARQLFLRRLKTSDNGSIYYQLHLEELQAIIKNQSRFYDFLLEDKEKLEKLVTFRIPYYVGPLQNNDAPLDKRGNRRFSWAERKPGMDSVAIKPWNWEDVIDRNKAAEKFILRMTGNCTYLQGEDVLPKCSLLYEEFCVLNELNGLKVSVDGDKEHRLDAAQREGIIEDLFHKYKTIGYKRIAEWLERECGIGNARVFGGQGETGLESKMSSYIFFCKDVFGVEKLDESDYPMIEEIILWNTLFEDRVILKEKLEEKYGSRGNGALDAAQIKKICKKRFAGWGRLSKRFLTGIKARTDCGLRSIMDVLREGDPNSSSRQGRSMVLMEILHDEGLRFQGLVDEFNKSYFGDHKGELDVNELPGSPAIRRSINQAIRIVDEIAKIAGKAPKSIFVEVTRDEDPRNKGRRTKRRYDQLKETLTACKDNFAQQCKELKEYAPQDIDDEKLMLYFAQGGKCLYSGTPIDINQLSNAGLYEVDHIIPRSYVKDDSLENKALVLRSANQRKTDAMLIDTAVRQQMSGYWKTLHDCKLIGDKKYNNLMRSQVNEGMMRGFIARQLVETSQMVKLVQSLLDSRYEETMVVPVKASLSHDLREAAGFVKCREANDYHHAHDAFLACRVGLFIQMRHAGMYDNPIGYAHVIRNYVRSQSKLFNAHHKMPGSSGFIVNSFMSSGFDKETGEIFKDEWDAEKEIAGIRKALDYRQCYITRMPYEDTGKFWDATVYSPRDAKMGPKLALPLKEGLDPQQFGGFSSQQFAYFFVYEAVKPKKNQSLFKFEAVPVWLASKISGDPGALEVYAKELAEAEGLEFVHIVRAKLLKRQLIEIDDDRLIITGLKEVRSGIELGFTAKELSLIENLLSNRVSEDDAKAVDELFSVICRRLSSYSLKLAKQLKLDTYRDAFYAATLEQKSAVFSGVLRIANGNDRVVNLSSVGGSANAGAMKMTGGKLLSDPSVNFSVVDQSVTGMFERKTRVGL